MDHSWLQNYLLLALRLEKVFRQQFQQPFFGYYYGPDEWKQQVEQEPLQEPSTLLQATHALQDSLTDQGFDPHRAAYLSKQLRAIEMVCRKLNGEHFSVAAELQHIYDITLTWTPETQFEAALALYDEALPPGPSSLDDRLGAWRRHTAIPTDKQELMPALIQLWIEEIRSRSSTLFDLPPSEHVSLEVATMPGGLSGVCLYQGNYHSRCKMDISDYIEAQDPVRVLLEDLCHEMYPGHHASFVAREQHLCRNQGYLEESVWLLHSPNAIIGEAIATHASSMLFTPEELEAWLAEHVYPVLDLQPDGIDLRKMQHATDMLNDIYGNAILLFHEEHRSDDEIQAYMAKYLRFAPVWLWHQPFHGYLGFYEYYAKKLMQPFLQGSDRHHVFQHLLRDQCYPSEFLQA